MVPRRLRAFIQKQLYNPHAFTHSTRIVVRSHAPFT